MKPRRLVRSLAQKFEILAANSQIGVKRDDLLIGMRMFPYKRYNIYYFPTEDGLEVYRVLHSSRDIDSVFDEIGLYTAL